MNISIIEHCKKGISLTLVVLVIFSSLGSVTFAATTPSFDAVISVPNSLPGLDFETVVHADVTENVSEVKATRTIEIQSLPANNSTLSIGTCDITFKNIPGSTDDELDCSDTVATIDRNTGAGNNLRNASSIA